MPISPGDEAIVIGPDVALSEVLGEVAARPDAVREILDRAAGAMLAFDAGRVLLHANRQAEELFDYPLGGLDGAELEVLLPERLRQPQAAMRPMDDLLQVDLPGRRRDGSEIQVEWAFRSVAGPKGPIFVAAVHDRAASDRALEALRASEERFRLLVEGVRDYAIFMLDTDGRVSSWNHGAERVKGWAAAEIVGQPYDVFFPPEDRAAGTPARLLATASREGHLEVRGWRQRKDGSRFFANAHLTALRTEAGELRGFAKITRDLTAELKAEEYERRLIEERVRREAAEAAQQRVQQGEERLRRLQRLTAALSEAATVSEVATVALDQGLEALDAAGGAVYLLLPDGDTMELVDQRGHPAEPLAQFQDFSVQARAPLSDAVRERQATFYRSFEECAALYPDLREAIRSGGFEASAALPLSVKGVPLGVLGLRFRQQRTFSEGDRALLTTLSGLCAQAFERARLFSAEMEARAVAEAANRSKDEFLAMLGHELRNPLAPIVTALHLMKLRGDQTVHRERTVIERQVGHLTQLIDDLLDVSRITRGKIGLKSERVEMAEVVSRAIEQASPLLEQRRQHLALAVADTGLALQGDPTRLAQVVSNLLTNAAKYTEPGGHIEVAAARRHDRIVLTVRDDGAGIAPELLPRVFELFEQGRQASDRSTGGLGLGLAIVHNIVTLHHGTVTAASAGAGQGSTLTVELPAAAQPAAVTVPPPAGAPAPAISCRILVVDDNRDAADLLVDVLRAAGHLVEVAYDGPAALHLAITFVPEIAVLDLGLPVMDGYELGRHLRAQRAAVRLVALTGYGQPEDRDRSRDAGFDHHLVKPVEIDALHAAIGKLR